MPEVFVNYTGANVYKAAGLRFMPGITPVDKAALEKAVKDLPLLRHRFENGTLKVTGEVLPPADASDTGGAGGGDDKPSQLEGLNGKDAIAIVEQTFDAALLSAWAAAEGRKGVANAIEAQLKKVDPLNNPDPSKGGAGGGATT